MGSFMEDVMKDMPPRQLASELWLAAAAKCVRRKDNRSKEIAIAQMRQQKAFVPADRLVGESIQATDFGCTQTRSTERLGVDHGEGGIGGP